AKLAPGSYDLQVVFPSQKVAERVEVHKRAFPVTQLVVTPELEEQGYTPSSIAENIALRENVMIQRAMERVAEPPYFTGPFYNPLASMNGVGAYGNIRKSGDIELQHLGLDLGAAMGTNVYAVNDGVVSFEDSLTNYGKTLIIDHGLGLYSLYLHLSEFQVSEKEEVKRGEVIARSGNTGYSIAPHLHYSMKLRGSSIDPSLFCDIVNREVFGLAGCLQRKIE
ncbi:MAG: M23 family metallopeptidase, partial [Candidatus Pacearchaeota archaeon]|nr:M23 family metallopeptidase [Candidatus Pacearchaeota archaeon]